jgi:hypothetical protein
MVSTFIDIEKRGRFGVSRSVAPEEGIGPSSFYLDFHCVFVKTYLGKPYSIGKLLFMVLTTFHKCFFFAKNIALKKN